MTATPRLNEALQDTAEDLRNLGLAAKSDFLRLQKDVNKLAQSKVIDPGMKLVKNTSHRLEAQARRSASLAKDTLDDVLDYVSDNPGRTLVGAIAGGVLLGLLLRR